MVCILECYLLDEVDQFENKNGVITRMKPWKKRQKLTCSLITGGKNNTLYVSTLNLTEHSITINSRTESGRYSILLIEQADQ